MSILKGDYFSSEEASSAQKVVAGFMCQPFECDLHNSSNGFPALTHFVIKENPGFMKWTTERGGLPELADHLVILENPSFVMWTVEGRRLPKLQECHLQRA